MRSVIIGTGSYISDQIVSNAVFGKSQFYEADGTKLYRKNESIIAKFSEITGIYERRYAKSEQNASDPGFSSSTECLGVSSHRC